MGPIGLGNGRHLLGNGPHLLGNGPYVLGNGMHVIDIHSWEEEKEMYKILGIKSEYKNNKYKSNTCIKK